MNKFTKHTGPLLQLVTMNCDEPLSVKLSPIFILLYVAAVCVWVCAFSVACVEGVGGGRKEIRCICNRGKVNIILSTETYHIIDTKMLSLMKPNAIIINTSRGALIDTSALIKALKEKRIGGACLDVYEEEEKYFFEDWSNNLIQDDVLSRLMTFPNVIITGHQAFFTHEALSAIAETTIFNIEQFSGNGKLDNEICYKCGTLECRKKIGGKCF